jgi:hypothetical protein
MKTNYLIVGVVAVIIIVAGLFFYAQNFAQKPQGRTLYAYKVGNSQVTTPTSFSDLDKESARTTAEEAIKIYDKADYKFECLVFDSAKTDPQNGEKFWTVKFSCNEKCSERYINCGASVVIRNNYEVIIGFPN